MRKFLVCFVLIFSLLGCNKQKAPVPDDDSVVYGYFKRFLSSDSSGEYLDTIQQLNIYYKTIKKYRKSSYCDAIIGCYYYNCKEYDKAFYMLKESEKKLDYFPELAPTVYYHLAVILEDIDKKASDEYFEKSLESCLEYKDSLYLSMTYLTYSFKMPLDSSRIYMRKSVDLLANTSLHDYSEWHMFRWIDHFYQDEPDSILKYGVSYYNRYQDADCLESISKAYIAKNEFDSAMYFLDKMEKIGYLRIPCYRLKSKIYARQGDYKAAYNMMLTTDEAWKVNSDSTITSSLKQAHRHEKLYDTMEEEKDGIVLVSEILLGIIVLIIILFIASYIRRKIRKSKYAGDEINDEIDDFDDLV
ncbi:MAG: hypothetical protein ACI3ZZ_00635 [Candidatus Aphodosoma sp.]